MPAVEPVTCDLALVGGRVLDPETSTDTVATVAITAGRIVAVTSAPVEARTTVDVAGHVVAPGWIDLHSHAQSVAGSRLQARDGVTTALDLEGGVLDVEQWYEGQAAVGRAIHYGASVSWQQARMLEVGALSSADLADVYAHFGDPAWKASATRNQERAMIERLGRGLDAGSIGVGLLMGYAPRVDPREYLEVSALVAASSTATFTHARDLVEDVPSTPVDGAVEIVRAALETGVRAHYCHVNSTSLRHLDRVHALIESSAAPVTTEAYPYGAGATAISADFLAPERLHERGLVPGSIVHTPTNRRIRDARELAELRQHDPGAVAIVHFLDESDPEDRGVIDRALTFDGTVVASDAMPVHWSAAARDPYAWPPPASLTVHPRTAGTFSRFWRRFVREQSAVSPLEAVRRCSLGPAQVLSPFVPAMRRKGRLQAGCDGDVVVLDPARVTDRATYEHGTAPSTGYRLVLVAGEVVVRDDELVRDALPGRPVRAGR